MSLTPSIFPNEFKSSIDSFLSVIGDTGLPVLDSNDIVIPSSGDYPSAFANSYETYSLSGEVLGAEHGSQDASILESFLRQFNNSLYDFATALANYWATVLLVPGVPAHGGVSVVSIVNDATSFISSFEAALIASLSNDQIRRPVFEHFIINIEQIALPDVTWTVTELMPNGSTASFPEKVF